MVEIHTGNGPRAFFSSGLQASQVAFTSIPVIDFGPMINGSEAERQAVGDAVRDACTTSGFFYAINHGVETDTIDATYQAARQFFDLPHARKQEVAIENSHLLRGYTDLLAEKTDPDSKGDLHEGFDIALDLPEDDPDVVSGVFGYGPNQWPSNLPGFKPALLNYHTAMLDFGARMFSAFALALELPEDYFYARITKPMAHMRVLRYPSQDGEIDEKQIGIGAHSDYECFTILSTDDTPALQVLNPNGEWIQAPPIEGAFIINIGDLMARWTNDYFQSTVHRAINSSGRERYSIPFFFGPSSKEEIEVLPSCQSPDHPAKYTPIPAGEYIKSRFDDTYEYRREDG